MHIEVHFAVRVDRKKFWINIDLEEYLTFNGRSKNGKWRHTSFFSSSNFLHSYLHLIFILKKGEVNWDHDTVAIQFFFLLINRIRETEEENGEKD